MKKLLLYLRREPMLPVSVLAAAVSLLLTPPSKALLASIDFKTLATLFMLLSVLDGFKHENLFLPLLKLTGRMRSARSLGFFLVFAVFFSSMFVTNDVSLIIFVPLTIVLYRKREQEGYILPLLAMENIAAVRGSLLTPFGSPQNLFLFSSSGMSAGAFIGMMLPLWLFSAALVVLFLLFIFRKEPACTAALCSDTWEAWAPERRGKRLLYLSLFILVLLTVVTRTAYWPYITLLVALLLLIFDRSVFKRVDYVLLLTFFCFFVFSSSVAANETVADFLRRSVSGHEYLWSIGISQFISNVPASIVLWPFTLDVKPLIYGLDTAGLVSVIGSLASVINLRLYLKEYPGHGKRFLAAFEKYSLLFFLPCLLLQLLLL